MLQALNTGHDGSVSTVHANSPADALARLETLVLLAGVPLPLAAVRAQLVVGDRRDRAGRARRRRASGDRRDRRGRSVRSRSARRSPCGAACARPSECGDRPAPAGAARWRASTSRRPGLVARLRRRADRLRPRSSRWCARRATRWPTGSGRSRRTAGPAGRVRQRLARALDDAAVELHARTGGRGVVARGRDRGDRRLRPRAGRGVLGAAGVLVGGPVALRRQASAGAADRGRGSRHAGADRRRAASPAGRSRPRSRVSRG